MRNKNEIFYIQDWAGNILDFKGTFKTPQLAVALEFETEAYAFDWITENIPEEKHEDVFVCNFELRGE